MHDRPTPGPARVNLIWVIGIAAGVIAGGIAAYSIASSSAPVAVATSG